MRISWRNVKAPFDFIPDGTTQNVFQLSTVKRFRSNLELRSYVQYERWAAPIYQPGKHTDVTVFGQLTWFLRKDR